MIKRKYSARSALPLEDAAIKRRRIEEPSSGTEHSSVRASARSISLDAWLKPTKSPALLSSSPKLETDTPYSSPPSSVSQADLSSPTRLKCRKPTFSFLRRSKTAPVPLAKSASLGNARKSADTNLSQLTIDLGGATTTTCPECGMSYTPSQTDDATLHAKHHAAHMTRLSVSLEMWRIVLERAQWKDTVSRECILHVTKDDRTGFTNIAERAMQAAALDLGAVTIPRSQLWESTPEKVGRYHVFLFLRHRKCVGLLLAERISAAHKVLADEAGDDKIMITARSLEIAETVTPADIGVSRIWTHRTERKRGVATRLLDALHASRAFGRQTTSKSVIAFSQPTDMGAALARRWFGSQHGWLVYRE